MAEEVKIRVYFLPLPFCEQADVTGQLNEPSETYFHEAQLRMEKRKSKQPLNQVTHLGNTPQYHSLILKVCHVSGLKKKKCDQNFQQFCSSRGTHMTPHSSSRGSSRLLAGKRRAPSWWPALRKGYGVHKHKDRENKGHPHLLLWRFLSINTKQP